MNLAIFASGTGTNAANIIAYFENHPTIKVVLVVCNNPKARVLDIADKNNIPSLLIEKQRFSKEDGYLPLLKDKDVDLIILAGFLWKIPDILIEAYPQRIINIHPALLPKYGGKGMYGSNVHEAVLAAGEKESGITIHYVDEHYDNGDIIFQAKCEITDTDTPESLAKKIHQLEHSWFPQIIEQVIGRLTGKVG
jgi:phosphoribosylglycinamide formyltransferase-1